jgi:hypothetical protein
MYKSAVLSYVRNGDNATAHAVSRDLPGNEIFTTKGYLNSEIEKLKKNVRHANNDTDKNNLLHAELTNEETARARYARGYKNQKFVDFFGPRFGLGIGLYYELLPDDVAMDFVHWMSELGLWFGFPSVNFEALTTGLKGLSSMAKLFGNEWSQNWKYFVNIETLGGYAKEANLGLFESELRGWVTGDKVHKTINGSGFSESAFLEQMREGIDEFLNDMPSLAAANENAMTLDEFVQSPGNWAVSGSTQIKRTVWYWEKDKRRRPRATKWRSGLSVSPEEVKNIILDSGNTRQRNKAIQKRETGKVRAVINSDDTLYLRMTYISTWLESALQGTTKTALYMTAKQRFTFWTQMGLDVSNDWLKMPLDQAHFDWQANKRMLSTVMDSIRAAISNKAPVRVKQDLLNVLELVTKTLLGSGSVIETVNAENEPISIPIEKGIMSGWRWTALVDTLVNYGEMFVARTMCKLTAGRDPVMSVNVQGDDDQVLVRDMRGAYNLFAAYKVMNLEINPYKFFVSTSRDEYLRQVAQGKVVCGYPARSINAVLWRNPIQMEPPSGVSRAREMLKNWVLLVNRGLDERRTLKHMKQDIARGNGLKMSDVEGMLSTPASIGGLGLFQNTSGVGVTLFEGKTKYDVRLEPRPPGLRNEVKVLEARGVKGDTIDNIVDRAMRERLQFEGKPEVLVETKVQHVVVPRTIMRGLYGGTGSWPIRAKYVRDNEVRVLMPTLIEKWVEDKDWGAIRGVIVPEQQEISHQIEQRGGRAVWINWLLGKLPFNLPSIVGWSQESVSVVHAGKTKAYWSWLCTQQHFDMRLVKRAAITCENQVRKEIKENAIRLGG